MASMILNLIGALLKESGALDALEAHLVTMLAAAQLRPPQQPLPGGDRADVVANALKTHFLHSERLSLMQRRMLGAGWQQGLSAPRNGKEFWAFCSDGVVKARWSTLAKGFVVADQQDRATIDIMLWLPLGAFPEQWQPPSKERARPPVES